MQVTSRHSLSQPRCKAAAVRQTLTRSKYDKNRNGDKKMAAGGAANTVQNGPDAGCSAFIPHVIICGKNATLPPSRRGGALPGTGAA